MGRMQRIVTAAPAYKRQFNNHLILVMIKNKPNPAHKYKPCTLHKVARPIMKPSNNHTPNFWSSFLTNIWAMIYSAPVQKGICGESGRIKRPAMMPVYTEQL